MFTLRQSSERAIKTPAALRGERGEDEEGCVSGPQGTLPHLDFLHMAALHWIFGGRGGILQIVSEHVSVHVSAPEISGGSARASPLPDSWCF